MSTQGAASPVPAAMNRLTVVSAIGFVFVLLCCGLLAAGTNLTAAFELYALPIMPDANIDLDGRKLIFTELGFETATVYRVNRPSEQVAAFYRGEMSNQGWELTKEKVRGLTYCLSFQRLRVLYVNVEIGEFFGTTTVTLDTARYCSGFSE